jgi:hypothetical protein
LKESLAELQSKHDDILDKYRRSIAENDNMRKRLTKQIEDAKIFGIQVGRHFRPGVDVMITFLCDFCQFSAEKMAFSKKTNVMITIFAETSSSLSKKRQYFR